MDVDQLPPARLPEGTLPDGRKPAGRRAAAREQLVHAGGLAILRELDRRMSRDDEPTTTIDAQHAELWKDELLGLALSGWISIDPPPTQLDQEANPDLVVRVGITPAGDRVLRLA